MAKGEGKYGSITVEGKDIPPDEPLFLLRSQDELAPEIVHAYAERCEQRGLTEAAADVRAFGNHMIAWQLAHADRVKLPD